MRLKNKTIEVLITGTRKDGYILKVSNKGDKYNSDIALTYEELSYLNRLLNKYFKRS